MALLWHYLPLGLDALFRLIIALWYSLSGLPLLPHNIRNHDSLSFYIVYRHNLKDRVEHNGFSKPKTLSLPTGI